MNPLSPDGQARSAEKMRNFVAVQVRDGFPSPELVAGAQDVFARYCGTASRAGHYGTIASIVMDKGEKIIAQMAYEDRMDLIAARRRERRWYRRLYRYLAIWWYGGWPSA